MDVSTVLFDTLQKHLPGTRPTHMPSTPGAPFSSHLPRITKIYFDVLHENLKNGGFNP